MYSLEILKEKNEILEEKNESLEEKNESLEDKNTNSCPAVFKENNILIWKTQERQSIPSFSIQEYYIPLYK